MTLTEELRWRGLIQDIMPGTEDQLNKEMTSGYIGFDPTADTLHIGSLVPILLLVHLQKKGHKPFALVGGATGMVGDPSGKSEERNLLTQKILKKNKDGVKKQLERFLDFDTSKQNAAVILDNYEWFKNMRFLSFIREVGKHITVNYMIAKESVKKRIEGKNGISFTEFTYQLMQGYDFYWLYTHYNCKLQMGGSDQWGNITSGTELIRRKANGEAFAFTCPLLTKTDGGKFGKTEEGNIWLDAEKTSPYLFYQFWLNAADADAKKWIKIFTFLPENEIEMLITAHETDASKRVLQKKLAQEITVFVHGEDEYKKAFITTEQAFDKGKLPAEMLSISDLEKMEGIKVFELAADKFHQDSDVVSFLADCGITASKGDAKKLIQSGGISINRKKVESLQMTINASLLLHKKYLLVQKGKRNFYLVKAV